MNNILNIRNIGVRKIEEKKEQYLLLNDVSLYYLDLSEIEPPTEIRTNYLRQNEIKKKEDKLAAALIQMQAKENSLQAVISGTEDSNIKNQKVLIVVPTTISTFGNQAIIQELFNITSKKPSS